MSDTKISNFLQVDGDDITNITAFAAVGTATGGATGSSGQLSVWSPQDPQNTAYMTVEFRAVYTDPVTGIITRGPWVANSLQV